MLLTYDAENLTEKNFLLYAAKHYDNPHCTSLEEFNSDLLIVNSIKRVLTKHKASKQINTRLLLNQFIILSNLFPPIPAAKILFLKLDSDLYPFLKTILVYLNRCPEIILLNGKFININAIDTLPEFTEELTRAT